MWEKLIDTNLKTISRGTYLRSKGKPPYESIVDFLIIEEPESPSGFSLMITSGYKAGLKLINLPKESLSSKSEFPCISIEWIRDNWNKWIYELSPDDVYVLEKLIISDNWKNQNPE